MKTKISLEYDESSNELYDMPLLNLSVQFDFDDIVFNISKIFLDKDKIQNIILVPDSQCSLEILEKCFEKYLFKE